MRGREALAITGVVAAVGGGFGAAHQFDVEASARAQAVAARTCKAFDKTDYDGVETVTKNTLDCLREGWVPGGETVDTSQLFVGDSSRLLDGFAELEESRGENFDASGAIGLALGGTFVGGIFVTWVAFREEREAERSDADEENKGPEADGISFRKLGSAIAEYETATEPYQRARYINGVHDGTIPQTIEDQKSPDWYQQFPRTDDETMARLETEHTDAQNHLVEALELESADVIPDLVYAFKQEQSRQQGWQKGPKGWDKGLIISAAQEGELVREPHAFLRGIATMAKVTGRSYRIHTGWGTGYAYVEPADSVEDVLPKLQKLGLELSSV